MTKIIGLTGGIGSGKTTVANYFKELGFPVYIADQEARNISESFEIKNAIQAIFGKEIVEGNNLDRKKLATIVFNNPEKLKQLNAIIHPVVQEHFNNWILEHSEASFVIKEVAILFESGNYKNCDSIITVTAPLKSRIKRVMLRDSISKEEVLNRMNNQWTDEKRIEKSTFIIKNSDSSKVKSQVDKIIKKIRI